MRSREQATQGVREGVFVPSVGEIRAAEQAGHKSVGTNLLMELRSQNKRRTGAPSKPKKGDLELEAMRTKLGQLQQKAV